MILLFIPYWVNHAQKSGRSGLCDRLESRTEYFLETDLDLDLGIGLGIDGWAATLIPTFHDVLASRMYDRQNKLVYAHKSGNELICNTTYALPS